MWLLLSRFHTEMQQVVRRLYGQEHVVELRPLWKYVSVSLRLSRNFLGFKP